MPKPILSKRCFAFVLQMWLACSYCLVDACAVAPSDFEEHYKKADEFYSHDKYSKCIDECDRAIGVDPSRYEAYLRKARALNQIGKAKEALVEFNKCLKLKVLGEIYQSRGLSYRMLENYPAALADWWHCIKLDPGYEKAYWRIADLQLERHKYQDCLKVYARAIANKSTAARGYRKRGQLYAVMNDYQKAIADHDASLRLKPDSATTYYSRAKVHAQFKHYDSAIKDMQRAIELAPKDSLFYTALGAFYVQAGRLGDAATTLDKAIAIAPDSASAHNNRGVVYEKLGQLENAKSEFDKAVQNDPGRAIYYANHARVAVTTGDTDDAVDDFINMDHGSESESASAANINYKIVIDQFDKVIKLNPDDAGNYYNRGVANYCIKDFKDAHRDFEKFMLLSQWRGDAPIYAAILDSTALRRMHKDREAAQILTQAESHRPAAWASILLQGITGAIPATELLQASRLYNREPVARCFLGLSQVASGKAVAAEESLVWVRDNADKALDEYSLATSQLAGLSHTAVHPRDGIRRGKASAPSGKSHSQTDTTKNDDGSKKNGRKTSPAQTELTPPTLIVK